MKDSIGLLLLFGLGYAFAAGWLARSITAKWLARRNGGAVDATALVQFPFAPSQQTSRSYTCSIKQDNAYWTVIHQGRGERYVLQQQVPTSNITPRKGHADNAVPCGGAGDTAQKLQRDDAVFLWKIALALASNLAAKHKSCCEEMQQQRSYKARFIRSPRSARPESSSGSDAERPGGDRNSWLTRRDVLGDLPSELANALFPSRSVVLKADHNLFLEGAEANGCYRLEEGLLKASVRASNGNERILAIFGPGAVIGELAMIDGGVRSASVTALRDSKLSFVSRATFEAIAQQTPELYRHLLVLVTQRLRDTNNALTATNFLSVKGRVASALLQLAEAFGRDVGSGRILIEQKINQNDLAAMAGVARENVTRVLKDWTNRSWVSRLAGYYCLENKKGIQGEAGM